MTNTKPEYQGQPLDLQPAVDLDEWQPMETARRNGELIEAWHVHEECVVTVQWLEELEHDMLPWHDPCGGEAYGEMDFSAWRRQSKGPQL